MDAKIIKSALSPTPQLGSGLLFMPYHLTVENAIAWPIDPLALFTLYASSAEHGRCIHVRAAAAFGNGVTGDAAKQIEDRCPTGAADLFTSLDIDLNTFGNAFLYAGPAGWERRPALTMHRKVGGGHIQTLYDPNGNNTNIYYTDQEIVHIKAPCPSGHFYSFPDWTGGQGMLDLVKSATEYNRAFFRNNMLPQYAIITYGNRLTELEEKAVQGFFSNQFQGTMNAHKTLYLHVDDPQQGKIDFQKLTADAQDGDFLKLLDSARDRIVIAHGVPPRMVGIVTAGSLGGGSEVTSQLHVFEELSNKPKRNRYKGALRPLLKREGIDWNAFEFEGIDLTPPEDDRSNTDHLADWVAQNIMDANEARELLNLPAKTQKSADKPDNIAALVRLLESL